jgi:hypothetical protein
MLVVVQVPLLELPEQVELVVVEMQTVVLEEMVQLILAAAVAAVV